MWQGLHQHLNLAVEAKSPLLHVMVADKISIALSSCIRTVGFYVSNMTLEDDEELRSMELEFVCALVNDNALHIEEVLTLIESFQEDSVRDRVSDSYDVVTEQVSG